MRVCPHCQNLSSSDAPFCLFCGYRFSKKEPNIVRYDPAAPRTRRTASAKAQRLLSVVSLFLAVAVAAVVLGAPPTERQLSAAGLSAPPAVSVSPAPSESPALLAPFDSFNGDYAIVVTLSEVSSEDPGTKAASEGLRGEYFNGLMTLTLNQSGNGTLLIDQLFSSPESISVKPFVNSEGVVSQNTLYGTISRASVKLSVICVCEESGISGFFWLDNGSTHIEFLYHD